MRPPRPHGDAETATKLRLQAEMKKAKLTEPPYETSFINMILFTQLTNAANGKDVETDLLDWHHAPDGSLHIQRHSYPLARATEVGVPVPLALGKPIEDIFNEMLLWDEVSDWYGRHVDKLEAAVNAALKCDEIRDRAGYRRRGGCPMCATG